MEIIWIVVVLLLAVAAAVLYVRLRAEQQSARSGAAEAVALRTEREQLQQHLQAAQAQLLEQRAEAERQQLLAAAEAERQLAEQRSETERRVTEVQAEADRRVAAAEADVRIWSERFQSQTAEREKLEKQFTDYFQNLANTIFEEKSRRFTDTNQKNIAELLKPFGEDIQRFRQRIEQEASERKVLEAEIKRLHEMSNQVSREANNLATALRGNSKMQGDWGEVTLVTLLENSGLQRGVHFRVQADYRTEEGNHVRPDVVLLLPDGKQMIIDSKVSLTAYANCIDAEETGDEAARKAAQTAHVASVRKHIDELAAKSYQKLTEASPDFVIMFIPSEPAFLMALHADEKLWDDAYRKKVILSCPTNLFSILKIVDDLWRRENQNRYALEIARQGGLLYDKFVGFAENFLAIGDALGRTDKAYRTALGQLREGNGNLVRRAESLRKLGVKAAKKMPAALTPLDDEAGDETLAEEAALPPQSKAEPEA